MYNIAFVTTPTFGVNRFIRGTDESLSHLNTQWSIRSVRRSRILTMNVESDTGSDTTSSNASTEVTADVNIPSGETSDTGLDTTSLDASTEVTADVTVPSGETSDTGSDTTSLDASTEVTAEVNVPSGETSESDPTSQEESSETETPKEPYPGFFTDMKRMGLSEEEAYNQAIKANKQANPVKSDKVGGAKNLFKADGTPYAPWMANMSTEYNNAVIKKRTDATGRLAADPQSAELSGVGLRWKMLGDELELKWATGGEEGNVGFVVYRRKGKEDKWTKLADYRDAPAELISKGPEGGEYSFLVTDPEPGSWVYRVSDVDQNQNVADLAQVLVEIDSAEDQRIQKVALVVLLAILAISVFAGLSLDPLSST